MRHMLKPLDFSVEETAELLSLAGRIEKNRAAYAKVMEGKKLTILFYEPSIRTRLSSEAVILNFGGLVLGSQSVDASSVGKGESAADTVRVVSCHADIIAIHYPREGVPMVASEFSRVPIINAGDGGYQHPTQALTDLMTIQSLKGRPDHMTVGPCGDLKSGHTVHPLVSSLIRYSGIRFVLISPPELRIPGYIWEDVLEKNRVLFTKVDSPGASMPDPDILCMTRVQKECFFNGKDYIRPKGSCILTEERLKNAKEGMLILYPLPRVNEIAVEVDKDPHAACFKQIQYGVYVRMALIMKLLEVRETC